MLAGVPQQRDGLFQKSGFAQVGGVCGQSAAERRGQVGALPDVVLVEPVEEFPHDGDVGAEVLGAVEVDVGHAGQLGHQAGQLGVGPAVGFAGEDGRRGDGERSVVGALAEQDGQHLSVRGSRGPHVLGQRAGVRVEPVGGLGGAGLPQCLGPQPGEGGQYGHARVPLWSVGGNSGQRGSVPGDLFVGDAVREACRVAAGVACRVALRDACRVASRVACRAAVRGGGGERRHDAEGLQSDVRGLAAPCGIVPEPVEQRTQRRPEAVPAACLRALLIDGQPTERPDQFEALLVGSAQAGRVDGVEEVHRLARGRVVVPLLRERGECLAQGHRDGQVGRMTGRGVAESRAQSSYRAGDTGRVVLPRSRLGDRRPDLEVQMAGPGGGLGVQRAQEAQTLRALRVERAVGRRRHQPFDLGERRLTEQPERVHDRPQGEGGRVGGGRAEDVGTEAGQPLAHRPPVPGRGGERLRLRVGPEPEQLDVEGVQRQFHETLVLLGQQAPGRPRPGQRALQGGPPVGVGHVGPLEQLGVGRADEMGEPRVQSRIGRVVRLLQDRREPDAFRGARPEEAVGTDGDRHVLLDVRIVGSQVPQPERPEDRGDRVEVDGLLG
ncbi:hypothetical protein [Streptomyces phaeoluteigriseus]